MRKSNINCIPISFIFQNKHARWRSAVKAIYNSNIAHPHQTNKIKKKKWFAKFNGKKKIISKSIYFSLIAFTKFTILTSYRFKKDYFKFSIFNPQILAMGTVTTSMWRHCLQTRERARPANVIHDSIRRFYCTQFPR